MGIKKIGGFKMKKRILIGLVLALVLAGLLSTSISATDITVTALPSYTSFSSTNTTWALNDLTGDGLVAVDTIYYANPLGDTTPPSATILDGECLWEWTNDSTVDLDIFVDCSAFTGGDATMTPSSDGSNGVDVCGCYSWVSGSNNTTDKEVMKTSGSSSVYTTATPGEDKHWGAQIETRTNAWLGNGQSTATISITVTPT